MALLSKIGTMQTTIKTTIKGRMMLPYFHVKEKNNHEFSRKIISS